MPDVLTSDETTVPHRGRWSALVALLTAEAMNLLDATIVQVAAPTIHAELGGSLATVQWYATAYTLPFAVLLITGGRLGDVVGRRRVFTLGVLGFMLGSLACALAGSVGLLIAFRVVQGAAAAMVIPQTIGLIKAMFAGREVSRALGTIGPVMGLAAVAGPVLGGVLTHLDLLGSSWRAVFLVNVPLSVLVLALVPRMLESRAPRRPGLDLPGTALAVAGVALLVWPLVEADATVRGLSMASGGVVTLGCFAWRQRRVAARGGDALIEVSLLAGRVFPAALVTSLLFFAVTTGPTLVVVLEMQLARGADVLVAGLTLVPWSAGLAVASVVSGSWLVPRCGARVMRAGLGVLLAGLLGAVAAYATAEPGRYPVALVPALAVIGLGVGLFTPAFFTAALAVVRPQEVGSAAGLLNAVQQLGGTLGVAVLGSVYLAGAAELTVVVAAACVVVVVGTSAPMVSPRAVAAPGAARRGRARVDRPRRAR